MRVSGHAHISDGYMRQRDGLRILSISSNSNVRFALQSRRAARMCPDLKEDFCMVWIFVVFGVGSIGLVAAQLLDYMVESKRARPANLDLHAFSSDVSPGDDLPSAEITTWYDEAA